MEKQSLLETARVTGSLWMFDYLATLGVCFTITMGGILYYFGSGSEEREQNRENLHTCQMVLLSSERYDGKTIEMVCNNPCLRDSIISIKKKQNGEDIGAIVRAVYKKCGE